MRLPPLCRTRSLKLGESPAMFPSACRVVVFVWGWCSVDRYPLVNIQKAMENHHAINGKIHYFDWAIFNCYVKLPEGRGCGRPAFCRIFDTLGWNLRELEISWGLSESNNPNGFKIKPQEPQLNHNHNHSVPITPTGEKVITSEPPWLLTSFPMKFSILVHPLETRRRSDTLADEMTGNGDNHVLYM